MNSSSFSGDIVNANRVIYTASEFAKKNLLYLQEIGESQAQQPHVSTRKNLSSYLFFIVTKGSGTLKYQNITYPLSQNDCVFIDCQNTYSHHSSENLWELKWIHLFGFNMNSIYEKYLESGGNPIIRPRNTEAFLQLWEQIFHHASIHTLTAEMEIYSRLTSLIAALLSECENVNAVSYSVHSDQILQNIRNYLDTHYTEKITLDFLSGKFFINKFYLSRIFREKFGDSITQYLLKLKITQAKKLLRFTDLSIEEISLECGMSDANYFSRIFKKIEGTTPGQFRKMW